MESFTSHLDPGSAYLKRYDSLEQAIHKERKNSPILVCSVCSVDSWKPLGGFLSKVSTSIHDHNLENSFSLVLVYRLAFHMMTGRGIWLGGGYGVWQRTCLPLMWWWRGWRGTRKWSLVPRRKWMPFTLCSHWSTLYSNSGKVELYLALIRESSISRLHWYLVALSQLSIKCVLLVYMIFRKDTVPFSVVLVGNDSLISNSVQALTQSRCSPEKLRFSLIPIGTYCMILITLEFIV